jgi:predicted nucleic acid-binding protein
MKRWLKRASPQTTSGSDHCGRLSIVVLDINALVRVALAKSPLTRALRVALEQGNFILLTSDDILIELGRVLRYSRIAARHALSESGIQAFKGAVRGLAVISPRPLRRQEDRSRSG